MLGEITIDPFPGHASNDYLAGLAAIRCARSGSSVRVRGARKLTSPRSVESRVDVTRRRRKDHAWVRRAHSAGQSSRTSTDEAPTTREPTRTDAPRTTPNASHTDETRIAPKAARTKPHSRHIPNAVRRQVWARDGGRCCFRGADNLRCEAHSLLEFHHVVPFARAGGHTADNIVLLCRAHNALFAERDYGRAFMQARITSSSHSTAVAQP